MLIAEFLVVLLLVLTNGFFAAAEMAVIAARKVRLQELAGEGRGNARAVLELRRNPERFLATAQVGVTVVGAAAAVFGGASIAHHIEEHFVKVSWLAGHAHGAALAVVVAGISYLSIVIGELVPKSLALRSAERIALLVGRPLFYLSWLARPIVWLLSSSANVVLRPFGDRTTFLEARHSAEELRDLVDEASLAGTIPPEAGEIASRALALPTLTAGDAMIPRQDVVMLSKSATRDDLRRVLLEHPYSRLPVYEKSVDNVVGYVTAKDVLALAWQNELIVLADIVRQPYFVPDSMPLVTLMKVMRAQRVPFAIVVDEHGGMSGIVTMEDLVEEIVGEIFSEQSEHNRIEKQPDGSALVSGVTPVREVNRALGIELPEGSDYVTIAGLCLTIAGGVPMTGISLELTGGVTLDIVDASPRRVRLVRVRYAGLESHRK